MDSPLPAPPSNVIAVTGRRLAVALLALSLVLAGCLGGDEASPSGSDDPSAAEATDAGNDTTPREAPEPPEAGGNATLAEPPDLEAGDWWDVRVDHELTDETYRVRRVVAGQVGDDYRVGLSSMSGPVVFGHVPSLGDVRASDLSYRVHDERFRPLDFPLEEGKTWTTTYLGVGYEATVEETDGPRAKVTYREDDGDVGLVAIYDAEVGALASLDGPLGVTATVVDHGTDHAGEVVVPYDRSQRLDGRFLGAADWAAEPAPPTGTVDVPSGYDEAVVGLILGGFGGAPGVYREEAKAPDGTTFEATSTGEFVLHLDRSTAPSGTWELTHAAAGPGFAATELVLYKVQTADLPAEPVTG